MTRDSAERPPLVRTHDGPSIEASPICKLLCLVVGLVLAVFGFVAALNEGYHEMQEIPPNKSILPWYQRDNPNILACLIIECLQLGVGIGSIVCLFIVMQRGRIPIASFNISATRRQSRCSLANFPRFEVLPEHEAYHPTKMFVSIFVIFAILGAICAIAETVGDLIEAIQQGVQDVHEILLYVDVLRCILLCVFIALQTVFFTKNNRFCLNWKLGKAWLAMSIVLSTDLSLSFLYVSHEMSEILAAKKTCVTNSTLQQQFGEFPSVVAEIMSPFLIEYFLMGAILAGSFLANAGRLASVLRRLHRSEGGLTADAIREKYAENAPAEDHCPSICMGHCCSLFFGLATIITIAISVLMRLFICETEPWHTLSIYIPLILAGSFVIGSVCCVVLLRAFRSAREASVETKARIAADRLILWCCVVALVPYELDCFWRVFDGNKELAYAIGTGFLTIFEILQSVLQVCVLECILLKRIRLSEVLVSGSQKCGAFLLDILMGINVFELLVSFVAFILFVFDSSSKLNAASTALLLISAPFQVFFRFHSAGCIHEFRKHCRDGNDDNGQGDQPPPSSAPVDCPAMAGQRDGMA